MSIGVKLMTWNQNVIEWLWNLLLHIKLVIDYYIEIISYVDIILCDSTCEKEQFGGECQKLLEASKVYMSH
jgi:hypothetical protein